MPKLIGCVYCCTSASVSWSNGAVVVLRNVLERRGELAFGLGPVAVEHAGLNHRQVIRPRVLPDAYAGNADGQQHRQRNQQLPTPPRPPIVYGLLSHRKPGFTAEAQRTQRKTLKLLPQMDTDSHR